MRYLLFILAVVLGFGCSNSKGFPTSIQSVPKPTHIQPDTCLTDRQLKLYFNFVKDSMKIESKSGEKRAKKEIDSLKIELKKHRSNNTVIKYEIRFDSKRFNDSIGTIRKMYSDSLRLAKVEVKQKSKVKKVEEKTKRVEVRQENKTERAKLNRFTLFIVGFIVGLILPKLIRFIMKII